MEEQKSRLERPKGVIVMAILDIIVGSASISYWGSFIPLGIAEGMETVYIAGFFMELLMGVLYVVVGVGLWKIKLWAYQGAIILAAYGLILAVLSLLGDLLPIVPILIHGGILYYIRRPDIKELFLESKFRSESPKDLDFPENL